MISGWKLSWDEEKESKLKELWSSGILSASQISIVIQMTRNAVIGKAHRMGLSKKKIERPERATERARKAQQRSIASRAEARKVLAPPRSPEPPQIEPVEGGISIMDLEDRHCRALVGTGDDHLPRYCGATKQYQTDEYGRYKITPTGELLFKGSYCPGHTAIYTRPAPQR